MNLVTLESPLGPLTVVASGDALSAVLLPGGVVPEGVRGETPVLREAVEQLRAYFAGARTTFELPLAPVGTPFQQLVWQALGDIPFGTTCSYAAVAQRLGRPTAMRAVGAANGQNPLAIIVPCHRVIGASGALVGYGGGLPAKRWLLRHESRQLEVRLESV